ncbi:MAG: CPBP family intramembrane metalloprotease [Dehalococcoidia bacterium]|nr:CPBP family intramembrane metalloprotease [Dehalococcoidia bacterium]
MISPDTYNPRRYYLITFLVTYVSCLAGAWASHRPELREVFMLLILPGMMAPCLISFAMMAGPSGTELRRDFRHRLFSLRLVQPRMLPVFFLLMPLSVLASAAISVAFGGAASQFQLAQGFSFSSGFMPVLVLLLLAATFEELGWRGYAFSSLLSRFTLFKAAMLFSVLWSLWHLPLVFVDGLYQNEIVQQNIWFGVNFFVSIIPMGVIISWVYIRNRSSIPAAIFFHLVVNLSQELFNITQATKCIETGVLVIVAAAIVMLDRRMFFSTAHLSEESPSTVVALASL